MAAPDAFAEVYRRHGGAVYGPARRVLGDESRAEEVVQEVFVRLWQQPERFDPDRGTLRSYLLAAAHGRAVDMVRSETSLRRREEQDARTTATAAYDLEHEVWDLVLAEQVKTASRRGRDGPAGRPRARRERGCRCRLHDSGTRRSGDGDQAPLR